MIEETIDRIEERVRRSGALDDGRRSELLGLLSTLRTEMKPLVASQREQAESIAGFTHVSAHEATRRDRDPRLLKLSLQGLASSVERFEISHPKLTQTVNSICDMLAGIGI